MESQSLSKFLWIRLLRECHEKIELGERAHQAATRTLRNRTFRGALVQRFLHEAESSRTANDRT